MALTPVTQTDISLLNNDLKVLYPTPTGYFTRVNTALLDDVSAAELLAEVGFLGTLAEFINLLTQAQLSYSLTEVAKYAASEAQSRGVINSLAIDRDNWSNQYSGLRQRVLTALNYPVN